jgi:iron complex transport system substrate-binding protein
VVAWQSGNSPGQLSQLESLGVPLFYSEPRQIEGIATSLERLGTLAGPAQLAQRAAAGFRKAVARLAVRYAGRDEVTVFYQIWDRPLMTINGHHLISAWLRLCGARNVFSDMPRLASAVSLEAVLAADPQAIISGTYAGKGHGWSALWRAWPQLEAVRHDRLYSVDAATMERQTPRALAAAERLCEQVDRVRR